MLTALEIRDLEAQCTVVSSLAHVYSQSGHLDKVNIIHIYVYIIYTQFYLMILLIDKILPYDIIDR